MKITALLFLMILAQTASAALPKNREYVLARVQNTTQNFAILLEDSKSMQTAYSYAKGFVSEEKMRSALNTSAKVRRIEECFNSKCIPVFGMYAGRSPN